MNKMKAWLLEDVGELHLKDVERPQPTDSHVLVKIKAAGICGSDIQRVYENGAHFMPLVIGHEFSGVVESVADECDTELIGKRVGVFPLIPCMKCSQCRDKKYEMCRQYDYLGSRSNGGFAEYVSVPKWNLIEISNEVSYEQAAMLEPLAVATHAMRELLKDETDRDKPILVWGMGTIGLMLISILKANGFSNITCVGNKSFQAEIAVKEIGISKDNILICGNSTKEELLSKQQEGFEYLFECVGKNDTVENVVSLAAPSGHIMFIGNPGSDMTLSQNVYWKILRNQLTIKGTWNSSFTKEYTDDWHYVLNLLEKGELRTDYMITHKYSFDNFFEGFELMHQKKEDYIKVMLVQ